MSKAKEIIEKIKALFADVAPATPAAPAAPAAPVVPMGTDYTLNDGSKITIQQAGAAPAVGDMATINGTPAAAGTYVLADNSSITTDATGAITAITPPQPVTVDPVEAGKTPPVAAPPAPAVPAAPPARFDMTTEGTKALLAAFANGTPEERIANLEVVCKALMEYNFGWQIRDAERKATETQAIEIYKQELTTATTALAKQEQTIVKQEEKLKALFSLIEELAGIPTTDPKTLTGAKKDKFEKTNKREELIGKFAAGIKKLKEENK